MGGLQEFQLFPSSDLSSLLPVLQRCEESLPPTPTVTTKTESPVGGDMMPLSLPEDFIQLGKSRNWVGVHS